MSSLKKEQILEVAIECFSIYGYEKTSMSDIGKRVGLNKASLYYHYKDKLSLFDAMVRTKRTAHLGILRQKLNTQSVGISQIITFLCSEIDFVEELAFNFLAPFSNRPGGKDDTKIIFQAIVAEDIELLRNLIQAAIEKGSFTGTNPDILAPQILQTARGLLLADCPLDLPMPERNAGYERIRKNIKEIITLILKGAGG